jgi:hypothetical protein
MPAKGAWAVTSYQSSSSEEVGELFLEHPSMKMKVEIRHKIIFKCLKGSLMN